MKVFFLQIRDNGDESTFEHPYTYAADGNGLREVEPKLIKLFLDDYNREYIQKDGEHYIEPSDIQSLNDITSYDFDYSLDEYDLSTHKLTEIDNTIKIITTITELIDLKVFLKQYKENPEKTKLSMIRKVMDDIQEDIDQAYYDNLYEDLCPPDYERICDNMGWPDFQDGGLFEQCIDIACDTMLQIYNYKPLNCLKRYEKQSSNK